MKETPLLMKGPLVLAALQRRKTQTRRVINPQPKGPSKSQLAKCPYGRPGDVLWVRETLRRVNGLWVYAADHSPVVVDKAHQSAMVVWTHHKDRDYCPSIHMPRWAARVLLTVKDVRVERVQDITESDAAAEGVEPFTMTEQGVADIQISDESPELKLLAKLLGPGSFSHRFEFQFLWDGINGRRGFNWDSNPWVYVVQYELFDPTTSQQPRRFAPHCDPQLAQ